MKCVSPSTVHTTDLPSDTDRALHAKSRGMEQTICRIYGLCLRLPARLRGRRKQLKDLGCVHGRQRGILCVDDRVCDIQLEALEAHDALLQGAARQQPVTHSPCASAPACAPGPWPTCAPCVERREKGPAGLSPNQSSIQRCLKAKFLVCHKGKHEPYDNEPTRYIARQDRCVLLLCTAWAFVDSTVGVKR